MKLLVQSDDYAFTPAVAYGICDGIDKGIIRNTGFFTNMPSVYMGAELAKPRDVVYGGKCCFGIDFNLVGGPSVSDPKDVPHLVDENGEFIKSGVRIRDPRWATEEGRREMFPYDEVYRELRAQYDKYVELMGHKPGYLHGHSISSEPYREAMQRISEEEGVGISTFFREQFNLEAPMMKAMMNKASVSKTKQFVVEDQLYKDSIGMLKSVSEDFLNCEYGFLIGHMGYIDTTLLKYTSLSIERMRDLEMVTDPWTLKWVEDNNIELVTYYDLQKELDARK